MSSGGWNIFRYAGDMSHILSKAILMFAIHHNRSAEGVSLITQILYAVVFCSRYVDIFYETVRWNFFFKVSYISSSLYIIAIMQWVFPRTREREISWKIGSAILAGSLVLSPFAMLIFENKKRWGFSQWLWDFSEILEAVCVLPQLVLLRQTSVPTVINSFYLITLGLYRLLYVLNWFWRGVDPSSTSPPAVSVIFGIIQTALFVDFFWCYYTRPRVRLRNGGIVDAQDYQRGWFIGRLIGNNVRVDADDEESGPTLGTNDHAQGGTARPKWGSRGISVSADEGVYEREPLNRPEAGDFDEPIDPDAKMQDPDDLAKALDDDDEDATLPGPNGHANGGPSSVGNGHEWRET